MNNGSCGFPLRAIISRVSVLLFVVLFITRCYYVSTVNTNNTTTTIFNLPVAGRAGLARARAGPGVRGLALTSMIVSMSIYLSRSLHIYIYIYIYVISYHSVLHSIVLPYFRRICSVQRDAVRCDALRRNATLPYDTLQDKHCSRHADQHMCSSASGNMTISEPECREVFDTVSHGIMRRRIVGTV